MTLPPLTGEISGIRFEDRRTDPQCFLPNEWRNNDSLRNQGLLKSTSMIILRPPRSLQKRQMVVWLERIAVASQDVENDVSFILADLSPFQAITFGEILPIIDFPAESSLNIYLVTEDWAVCCFHKMKSELETKRSFLEISLEKSKEFIANLESDFQSPSAIGILRLLRHADSCVFWEPISSEGNLPSDMFVEDRVAWYSSDTNRETEGDNHQEMVINGYLNLPRALADEKRYQACHRALRRCMNLFHEFEPLASDNLVESIMFDADRGLIKLLPTEMNNFSGVPKKLIIGSVHATSSTVNRLLKKAIIPKGSRELYIFDHPDAFNNTLSVLEWLPPPSTTKEKLCSEQIKYERIPETPYIAKSGEKAILFPRFRYPKPDIDILTDSLYPRSPRQTYEDFQKLNVLKMGHWIYGKSHDLLTINLARALELSNLDNGPLIEWLEKKIKDLCFDGIQWKSNVKILYPSHIITDQMVSFLKKRLSREISAFSANTLQLEDNIIPLKFLTTKIAKSPFRITPLTYDRLKKIIQELSDIDLSPHIILLDAGTISGKTFKELEQLAIALGAKNVETVALIDRNGLPIYLDYINDYLKKHHRFWRWDVPTLGPRRGCPLCTALENSSIMHKNFNSSSMCRRLQYWQEIWKAVEVVNHWENHGLKPTPLGKDSDCDTHSFGIYPNGSHSATHSVRHKTSIGMVAGIMEITLATTWSHYALKKAKKMVRYYGPEAGIEILTSQLLLFYDEIGYWGKVDLFLDLLRYLWDCETDSDISALAGLSITLIDDDLLYEIWPKFRDSILCNFEVRTIDARISAEYLRARFNNLFDNRELNKRDKCSENPSEAEHYNYLVMFSDNSFRDNITRIFDIIGETHQALHNMGLHRCLDEVSQAINDENPKLASSLTKKARNLLETLYIAINEIPVHFYKSNEVKEKDLDVLNTLLKDFIHAKNVFENDYLLLLEKWRNKTSGTLWGDSSDNFAKRYRSQFIYLTKTVDSMDAFLSDIESNVIKDWEKIGFEKIEQKRSIADRWLDKSDMLTNVNSERPIILGANNKNWQREFPIYFDLYVSQFLFEIMTNCFHVELDIPNPWGFATGDQDFKATMWWRVKFEINNFVEVEFVNACNININDINLKPTVAYSGLERVGGEVLCSVIKNFNNNSVSGSRYSGNFDRFFEASNIKQLAVTNVRIPTMRIVKKG